MSTKLNDAFANLIHLLSVYFTGKVNERRGENLQCALIPCSPVMLQKFRMLNKEKLCIYGAPGSSK